jgi:hypothetical protein
LRRLGTGVQRTVWAALKAKLSKLFSETRNH